MKKANILIFFIFFWAGIGSSAHAQTSVALNDIFNGNMLGTNLRYFESVAGIARESWGNTHVFQVAGCHVEAEAVDGRISSLSLEVTENCQPDVSSFVGESYAPDSSLPMTFGNFMKHAGPFQFYADCLSMCGNAYDPSVYAFWEGPHAAGFMNMKIEAKLVDDASIDAAQKWQNTMETQKGIDYVVETKFSCDGSFNTLAAQLFENILVTRITLGSWVTGPQC